jgi:hypothetical protein
MESQQWYMNTINFMTCAFLRVPVVIGSLWNKYFITVEIYFHLICAISKTVQQLWKKLKMKDKFAAWISSDRS